MLKFWSLPRLSVLTPYLQQDDVLASIQELEQGKDVLCGSAR